MKTCAKRANCLRREPPTSPRYDVWYNLTCKATPLLEVVDPVTGVVMYSHQNDLGRPALTDNAYEYCREVNTDGNCSKFYPKES